MYITVLYRLLIRSVGLLECEEDVERLLLETVTAEYKKGVRQIRHNSSNKLRKIMRKLEANSTEEHILNLEVTSLFAQYFICSYFALSRRNLLIWFPFLYLINKFSGQAFHRFYRGIAEQQSTTPEATFTCSKIAYR